MNIGTFVIIYLIGTLILTGVAAYLVNRRSDTAGPAFFVGGAIFALCSIIFLFLKPWGYVENYELGYMWDARTGQITVLNKSGYVPRTPFIQSIHTIDTRPQQVCLKVGDGRTSTGVNSRVLNCKLVSFNPAGLNLFLQWHGRDTYYGSTLQDILMIYAYDGSGASFPFINIHKDWNGPVRNGAVQSAQAVQ